MLFLRAPEQKIVFFSLLPKKGVQQYVRDTIHFPVFQFLRINQSSEKKNVISKSKLMFVVREQIKSISFINEYI